MGIFFHYMHTAKNIGDVLQRRDTYKKRFSFFEDDSDDGNIITSRGNDFFSDECENTCHVSDKSLKHNKLPMCLEENIETKNKLLSDKKKGGGLCLKNSTYYNQNILNFLIPALVPLQNQTLSDKKTLITWAESVLMDENPKQKIVRTITGRFKTDWPNEQTNHKNSIQMIHQTLNENKVVLNCENSNFLIPEVEKHLFEKDNFHRIIEENSSSEHDSYSNCEFNILNSKENRHLKSCIKQTEKFGKCDVETQIRILDFDDIVSANYGEKFNVPKKLPLVFIRNESLHKYPKSNGYAGPYFMVCHGEIDNPSSGSFHCLLNF